MASTEERRGIPFRRLAWAALAFVVVAGMGAWLAYDRLVYYRRCAVEHLPPETELVARLDVEQVVLFEPVRRHLIPLIDRLPPDALGATANAGAEPTLSSRLRRDAGLNLGMDLREVLVATAPGQRWLVVLGGLFRQGLVAGIERALKTGAADHWRRVGELLEFVPSGAALGQASDGALLLASDRALLEAALPRSTRFRDLGLLREGSGSARLSGALFNRWAVDGGGPRWFETIQSASLEVRLTRELEIDVRAELREASSAAMLASLAAHRPAPPPGVGGPDSLAEAADPWGLVVRAKQSQLSGNTVQFVSIWRQAELERAARDLAAWLERHLLVRTSPAG